MDTLAKLCVLDGLLISKGTIFSSYRQERKVAAGLSKRKINGLIVVRRGRVRDENCGLSTKHLNQF